MMTRPMTLADLTMVLGWARDEGWNPGHSDAEAFLAADPEGFFLAEVDGKPAAAISVVNHDDENAFLGLYICRPEFRGKGHGLALWTAALEHAGTRSVGLDGVPAQQANYERSGFVSAGQTVRYKGNLRATHGNRARPAREDDLPDLIAADATAAGHARTAYANAWFRPTRDRQTLLLGRTTGGPAFATFRSCAEGTKVGPLHAASADDALTLLQSRPAPFADGPLFVDVPAASPLLREMLEDLAFQPVFDTARMVRGAPPPAKPPAFYAVTTLELG
jgi:ribosomal protein S18 acetylase RimI-like enzyme